MVARWQLVRGDDDLADDVPEEDLVSIEKEGHALRITAFMRADIREEVVPVRPKQAFQLFDWFEIWLQFLQGANVKGRDDFGNVVKALIQPGEAAVKRAMVRCADRVVVLADSSKIGRQHLISFAPVDAVDVLVTDTELDDTDCKELTDNGIEVVTA